MTLKLNRVEQEIFHIDQQKTAALEYLTEAWNEAIADGVEADALAHVALFTAVAELVNTYGEDVVIKMARKLPTRIQQGEFTFDRNVQ